MKTKKIKSVFGQKVNITFDKRLNNIKPSKYELEKVEKANESLKKIKLPK